MRQAAADPEGAATRERSELLPGLRSLHLRHVRSEQRAPRVRRPVHILYNRVIRRDLVEIVRVLHERMEPRRHVSAGSQDHD